MGHICKKFKGWIIFLGVTQILVLFVFIFSYDLYVYPQTWICPVPLISFEELEKLSQLSPKYSESIDSMLLIVVDIIEGTILLGSNIGISQLVFERKYFIIETKEKMLVFAFGGIAIVLWLLYCRYGCEYYRLAWNVVIPEIFSLMLLAFILLGGRQGKR